MAKTTTNAWDNKELGVLWKKTKKGSPNDKYLTGTINLKNVGLPDKDIPIIVFTNKNKNKDTHPDLRIYVSEKRDSSTASTAPTRPAAAPEDTNELI